MVQLIYQKVFSSAVRWVFPSSYVFFFVVSPITLNRYHSSTSQSTLRLGTNEHMSSLFLLLICCFVPFLIFAEQVQSSSFYPLFLVLQLYQKKKHILTSSTFLHIGDQSDSLLITGTDIDLENYWW